MAIAFLTIASPSLHGQQVERDNSGDIKKERTITRHQEGRKVAITQLPMEEGKIFRKELTRIAEAKIAALRLEAQQRSQASPTTEKLISKSFVVSAAILPDQTTYIECWSTKGGPSVKGFSNCNWNHFLGQQTFQNGYFQYTFILLPTSVPLKEEEAEDRYPQGSPESLPSVIDSGATYMVTEGAENDEVMDFFESVHERYDREKRTLIRAFRNKKQEAAERERQLLVNPPKPQDVMIRFGRREKKKAISEK